ncbi:hypothetical protein HQ37_08100 [Porphyromonas sp. COT-239 OH1446]|nr:hypothetical protein HQ37_08100 [Porphyromonas sp. COT-239 OH1446]
MGHARYLLLVCLVLLASSTLWAQRSYRVDEVPNVQLLDSTRRVSDPEGIVQDIGLAKLDAALSRFKINYGVEVAVVLLPSIGERDIEGFAVELFRHWGLGDKKLNNGLLILYVADQRRIRSEVGYGLEGVLTDGRMGRIQRTVMIPHFREGRMGLGLLAGLDEIEQLIQNEGLRPSEGHLSGMDVLQGNMVLYFFLLVTGILFFGLLISLEYEVNAIDKPSQARARWEKLYSSYRLSLVLFLLLGVAPGVLIWLWGRVRLPRVRRMLTHCDLCGAEGMERKTDFLESYLSPVQRTEQAIGSRAYSIYHCSNCNEVELHAQTVAGSSFVECPVCHGRTMQATRQQRIRLSGKPYIRTYLHCLHCQHDDHADRRDSDSAENAAAAGVLLGTLISIAGSGSRRHGGGGWGGGSWGGGSSGGGGATSSW